MKLKKNDMPKWTLQDIGRFLKQCFRSIVHGKFLLQMNVERYMIHIVLIFFLFAMAILFSLGVDNTLASLERNRHTIEELEIRRSKLEFELKTINRRAEVISILKEQGSKVGEPEEPATILK